MWKQISEQDFYWQKRMFRDHLTSGDRPELLLARLANAGGPDASPQRRKARVALLAAELFQQVSRMDLVQLLQHGQNNSSPRMKVRKIHNNVACEARGKHCHLALYRSKNADEFLSRGNVPLIGNAVIHCEHTVPTGDVLAQLNILHRQGALRNPADLLDYIFSYGIVTALLQTERRGRVEGVNLDARRVINGVEKKWKDCHPEFLGLDNLQDTTVRPFLRYIGTGIEVIYAPTGEYVGLDTWTVAEHKTRISNFEIYNAQAYFN